MKTACLTLAAAVLLVTPANADLVLVGAVTEESNSFGPDIDAIVGEATVAVASPGTFDQEFSALGEQAVSITWQAPAGQLIEVVTPVGFEFGSQLRFNFRGGNNFFVSGSLNASLTPTLIDLTGGTLDPVFASVGLSGPGGDAVGFNVVYDLEPGVTYRFAGLTATGVIPAGFDTDFDDLPIEQFAVVGEAVTGDSGLTPPGQWVRLVPIPEPSSLALLGLGGPWICRRGSQRR